VVVGAASTVGLFLRAGQRTPRLLLLLMAIWVLSPFIALVLASVVFEALSSLTRATLYGVMLIVTLGSLANYGDDAMGHRRPQAAFVYVLVPPASWAAHCNSRPDSAFLFGHAVTSRLTVPDPRSTP